MASNQLKAIQDMQALASDAKARFIERFKAQYRVLLREANQVAGIKINAQLLYQNKNDEYNILTMMTDSMSDLEDAPKVDKLVGRMKVWVQEALDWEAVRSRDPSPTVIGDATHDGCPPVPLIIGLRLVELQKLLHLVFTLLWVWQGGHGKLPWELVCNDLDTWVHPDRRPAGAVLGDPNTLCFPIVLARLKYYTLCQSSALPPERRPQFTKVLTGPSPINPSLSQESSRRLESIPHQNNEVWILEFGKTVTKCHALGGMTYSAESLEYAEYLECKKAAAASALKANALPAPYLGLPTGSAHQMCVIYGQEKALLIKWCRSVPAECSSIVLKLIHAGKKEGER
ncbi:hypothetical protein FRC07_003779 [Ceratobasidium sp. 392]|nr:hypothetical protein FRC07_003779 [Ceratobasidium sp. 392]